MKEQLISFKTAKLAKKKGFYVGVTKNWYTKTGNFNSYSPKTPYYVVTQSLLQKWLREVHNIYVEIYSWYTGTFYAFKLFKGKDSTNLFDIDWAESNSYHKEKGTSSIFTYEESLEKGLQEALKLIK